MWSVSLIAGGLYGADDMAGGYREDSYAQGETTASGHAYHFMYWNRIDIFIYFSHQRVTVPPVVWCNAAHRHGVKVLGTIITEWEGGAADNIRLLNGPSDAVAGLTPTADGKVRESEFNSFYADRLVAIAKYYGFDGWFINIESDVPPSHVNKMIEFVRYLTKACHASIPGSLVIWYDSIDISDGKIRYQNALTKQNKPFFDGSYFCFCIVLCGVVWMC